ncbi:MAG TPA: 50S ribosomal protein L25 [Candidatus Lustribacter sp.]|jgi:large subunit ribosomal protein L25|nr:50S ribosomal protein L25 [Candidatus Lustribacter sp.]
MAKTERVTNVTIHQRAEIGTTGAKKARREGRIPGALYGHGKAEAIAVDARTLNDLLSSGGHSHIVDATIGGKKESVLLREVQRDPITHRPIAADFQRVSSTEAIYASVSIVTVGIAPGVKDQGGVMDIVTHALEVKGPAGKLPEHFEIDVSELNVHDHVTAGEVKLPAGFTLVTPADTVVVGIEGSRTASEDAELTAASAAAAPAATTEPAAEPPAE